MRNTAPLVGSDTNAVVAQELGGPESGSVAEDAVSSIAFSNLLAADQAISRDRQVWADQQQILAEVAGYQQQIVLAQDSITSKQKELVAQQTALAAQLSLSRKKERSDSKATDDPDDQDEDAANSGSQDETRDEDVANSGSQDQTRNENEDASSDDEPRTLPPPASDDKDEDLSIVVEEEGDKVQDDVEELFDPSVKTWEKIGALVGEMVMMSLFGLVYLLCCKSGTYTLQEERNSQRFKFGLLECGDLGADWRICLSSCLCWPVVWADTQSSEKLQFFPFWPGLLLVVFLNGSRFLTFGIGPWLLLFLLVYSRQKMREKFDMPSGTCELICCDCLAWTFCPCCAVAQEARQVEYKPALAAAPLYEGGLMNA